MCLGRCGAWSPVRCCGWPGVDAVRTPGTPVVPLVPRSGRHAERWAPQLPLPLDVVVTSLLFAQYWGSDVRKGSACGARSAVTPTPGSSTPARWTTARRSVAAGPARSAPPVHHGRGVAALGGQAQRRHRAVQPRQGDRRGHPGLPGPPGRPGRRRATRPAGRGDRRAVRAGGGAEPGRRPGDPRSAARARRGGLPAVRAVYRSFTSADDFAAEIADLRRRPRPADVGHRGPTGRRRVTDHDRQPHRRRSGTAGRTPAT